MIGKYDQSGLSAVDQSVLGQPPGKPSIESSEVEQSWNALLGFRSFYGFKPVVSTASFDTDNSVIRWNQSVTLPAKNGRLATRLQSRFEQLFGGRTFGPASHAGETGGVRA